MSGDRYTDADVRKQLRQSIKEAGSLRKWAEANGVTAAHVSQVLVRGLPPGPRIAAALGFRDDGRKWVR